MQISAYVNEKGDFSEHRVIFSHRVLSGMSSVILGAAGSACETIALSLDVKKTGWKVLNPDLNMERLKKAIWNIKQAKYQSYDLRYFAYNDGKDIMILPYLSIGMD